MKRGPAEDSRAPLPRLPHAQLTALGGACSGRKHLAGLLRASPILLLHRLQNAADDLAFRCGELIPATHMRFAPLKSPPEALAEQVHLQPVLNAAQGVFFQSAYLRLTDTDFLGHLDLGLARQIA